MSAAVIMTYCNTCLLKQPRLLSLITSRRRRETILAFLAGRARTVASTKTLMQAYNRYVQVCMS